MYSHPLYYFSDMLVSVSLFWRLQDIWQCVFSFFCFKIHLPRDSILVNNTIIHIYIFYRDNYLNWYKYMLIYKPKFCIIHLKLNYTLFIDCYFALKGRNSEQRLFCCASFSKKFTIDFLEFSTFDYF